MADVALWLGPYMSISSENAICTRPKRPGNAGKSQQTNHHTDQPDDPQIQGPVYSPVGGHEIATKTQTKHTTQIGTSFCSILRPLLVTLLHPLVAEFAVSILSLEDAKFEIASLSNICGLHMFKQWSNSGAICSAGQ